MLVSVNGFTTNNPSEKGDFIEDVFPPMA